MRDGRAVANALINSENTIGISKFWNFLLTLKLDITNGNPPFIKFHRFEQALNFWNETVAEIDTACNNLKVRLTSKFYLWSQSDLQWKRFVNVDFFLRKSLHISFLEKIQNLIFWSTTKLPHTVQGKTPVIWAARE